MVANRGTISCSGPVVRKDPDGWLLLDVAAASRRLLWRLTVGRYGGGGPNARAQHFEASVQAIDAAGFGPEMALRSLIRRPLKRQDGTPITDIDAIAVIAGEVILIDAKSYPYTAEYGAGRYQTVKNVTDKLTLDLAKWSDRVSQLRPRRSEPIMISLRLERHLITGEHLSLCGADWTRGSTAERYAAGASESALHASNPSGRLP
jgi:hypothetical protein